MKPTKILVIQLRQLGDILLTTPCVRAIKQERPDAHLTFLCHRMGKQILYPSDYIDELLTYDEKAGLGANLSLLHKIRQARFDLVIDFMNNPRSALFTRISGARRRVAFRSHRSLAYTDTCAPAGEPMYIVREKFLLLRACGFSPRDEALDFPTPPAATHLVGDFCSQWPALVAAPLRVAFSPTHRRSHRKWPLANYIALAERLSQQWQATVTWIWGPGEEEEIDKAIALCRVPTYKAPRTTLQELGALIGAHDLFVGNSNGPSHIAVATDTPSLQLHGHTLAQAWCPCSERHRALQSPEFGHKPLASLAAIGLDAVWQELEAFAPYLRQEAAKRRAQEALL